VVPLPKVVNVTVRDTVNDEVLVEIAGTEITNVVAFVTDEILTLLLVTVRVLVVVAIAA